MSWNFGSFFLLVKQKWLLAHTLGDLLVFMSIHLHNLHFLSSVVVGSAAAKIFSAVVAVDVDDESDDDGALFPQSHDCG